MRRLVRGCQVGAGVAAVGVAALVSHAVRLPDAAQNLTIGALLSGLALAPLLVDAQSRRTAVDDVVQAFVAEREEAVRLAREEGVLDGALRARLEIGGDHEAAPPPTQRLHSVHSERPAG